MPNITVSVDEPVYQSARIAAALRNTTVTQLVREFLRDLDRQTAERFSTDSSGLAEHLCVRAIEPYLHIHRPHSRAKAR
jgi:hypothetical protein